MPTTFSFHPEALHEYAEAVGYYLNEASPGIAEAFSKAIEAAIDVIVKAPTRYQVVDETDVRKFVVRRFPFIIHYRSEQSNQIVVLYAIMHTSREPDYWRHRPT